MAEIGKILKEEICRLARKEVNKALSPLRTASGQLKRALIDLKRRLAALEKIAVQLEAEANARRREMLAPDPDEVKTARFGPKNITKLRKKLGLSQRDFGLLADVAVGTVYLWEKGKAAPRGRTKTALVEMRKIGRREARKRLNAMQPAKEKAVFKPKKKTASRKKKR
jgi:DNA-binding transcriptional regulator YiaG